MAVLKCKMCGGNLNIVEGETVAVCEYCDTKQTVPTVDNEKKLTLFARANRLRAACEFDKAAGVYENIIADFPEEAEAYWGLVLCKFGIEYVDDPATGKKIPTCHRSSFDSIMDDTDFEQVMENADSAARRVYREEAKAIEELRKDIIEVSNKEEPYDIFICYKETDENGDRTVDSVIAQDIYDRLTEKQYRVFFARVSLEDKLGTAFEPYIFAALNSAKIMLAIGTDYDYYNAVWVKNEWSRFLMLMAKNKNKMLIPCYKNLDAYDIPKEFKHLQGQDMGKVGAMQDLLRGIEKILPKQKSDLSSSNSIGKTGISSLLKRVFIFLDDDDWDSADQYCEKILDIDPENGDAYLGKLLVEYKSHSIEEISNGLKSFERSKNYQKIVRYGDDRIKNEIEKALESASKNQDLYMSVLKGKWDDVSVKKYYLDIIEYIKVLLLLNSDSPIVTDEISKYISQADNLLKQQSKDFSCVELSNCFQSFVQLSSINPSYYDLMYKTALQFLDKFISLSNRRIEYTSSLEELKELLSIYNDLLEYDSIAPDTSSVLRDQLSLCECKYEKERKVSDLKSELRTVDSQIATMQKNLYNSPEKGQIIRLEKENKRLCAEKEKISGFKKNVKKELQNKINDNNNKIKLLEEQNKQNVDSIRRQLPEVNKHRDEIEAEIQRIYSSID